MRRIENATELVASDVTDRLDCVRQQILTTANDGFVPAGNVGVTRQAHRYPDFHVQRLGPAGQSVQVKFLGSEIGEFDGAISAGRGSLQSHFQSVLCLTAGPDE